MKSSNKDIRNFRKENDLDPSFEDRKKANAYLQALECENNSNLSKKKQQLEREIDKIFGSINSGTNADSSNSSSGLRNAKSPFLNKMLPDIRLSAFQKRNSDDSFISLTKNKEHLKKTQDSERLKSQSQLGINKNPKSKKKPKKIPLNDTSCYGMPNRFDYKQSTKGNRKNKETKKLKDTSLPPPINKNREFE